jgi:hypothetical protein
MKTKDKYLNENKYKNLDITGFSKVAANLVDWANDNLEVVESQGSPADKKMMMKAIENLNSALNNVVSKIQLISKTMNKFK